MRRIEVDHDEHFLLNAEAQIAAPLHVLGDRSEGIGRSAAASRSSWPYSKRTKEIGMTKPALALVVSFVALQARGSSPAAPPKSASDVTNADIRATIAKAPADGILDQQIRIVDMGKYNVAVGVLPRSAKPAQQGAIDYGPA